jgi:hypothetical protein
VLVELVRDFMRWCNLQFTLQVRQLQLLGVLPSYIMLGATVPYLSPASALLFARL